MDSSLIASEGINLAVTLIQNSSLQIVRQYISVVKTPEFMVLCDDSPNKVKHACVMSGPLLANLFNWFKCDLFNEAFLSSHFLFSLPSFIYLFFSTALSTSMYNLIWFFFCLLLFHLLECKSYEHTHMCLFPSCITRKLPGM